MSSLSSSGDTKSDSGSDSNEFKLAGVTIGHSGKDVRCICPLDNGSFISGGRDQTMCIFERKGNMYVEKFQSFQTSWVNAVCALPPLPNANNAALQTVGGVVAGLQDGTLAVHDHQAKLLYQLPGHTSQVSSLSVTPDGLIVSGSWDGTIRVWDLKTEKCIHTETGFANAVTVLALPNGDIATGDAGRKIGPSQVGEMKIRVFSPDGDGHYSLKSTVEDHLEKITELVVHGVGFASTSNDGTTRLRTLDGQTVSKWKKKLKF
jgi:phospholipase A-2-activating protein